MGKAIIGLLTIALIGAGVANALKNPKGDKAVLDGFANIYKIGVNGMLGKSTS